MKDILVVIPTYNERTNLPDLVRAVVGRPGYRVLVVDDGSPDGTGEAADALCRELPGRVEVMHRTGRRGLGLSYIEGFRRALDEGRADLIVQMDADWSHDPAYLPDMVEAAGTYDLVIGSRYLRGVSVVNWPLRRLVLSAFANRYVQVITGLETKDCTSGFRCWRRELLARLPIERVASKNYAFQVELLFEAHRRGGRVGEVPIIFVERRAGASKLSKGVLAESVLMPWRLRLRSALRPRPDSTVAVEG
jgi:dolichol-phosphate mannosyltransferase